MKLEVHEFNFPAVPPFAIVDLDVKLDMDEMEKHGESRYYIAFFWDRGLAEAVARFIAERADPEIL